jgi:hypothetical protein
MNRLSSKKHGMVTIYVRPEIERKPWVRRLGGRRTTKDLLEAIRKYMAKRLKRRMKDVRYEAYKDGWIFLCDSARVVWTSKSRDWQAGEEWIVEHHEVHREHPGYDE